MEKREKLPVGAEVTVTITGCLVLDSAGGTLVEYLNGLGFATRVNVDASARAVMVTRAPEPDMDEVAARLAARRRMDESWTTCGEEGCREGRCSRGCRPEVAAR